MSGVVALVTVRHTDLFHPSRDAPHDPRSARLDAAGAFGARAQDAREVSHAVAGYMLGNLATSMIAGIVVFAALRIMDVPYAGVLAIWVGVVDFLPLVGGLLAGVPTVAVALLHSLARRRGDTCGLPRLPTDRESHPQPGRDEPDRAFEPALGVAGNLDRRRAGRDHRVHLWWAHRSSACGSKRKCHAGHSKRALVRAPLVALNGPKDQAGIEPAVVADTSTRSAEL